MNTDKPRRRYELPRYRIEVMAARAWAIETYNLDGRHARAFMARWQRYCDATSAEILDIAEPDAPGHSSVADDVDQWLRGDQE